MKFPAIRPFATLSSALLALLLMTAASDSRAQTKSTEEAILASVRPTILSVNQDWVVAMRARDAHRATRAYAQNAIFVTRDGRVLMGHDEIEKFAANRIAQGPMLVGGSLDDDGLQVVGELVYEWGHSALTWKTGDGKLQSTSGHFLTVWKRSSDAHWEIIRNLTL